MEAFATVDDVKALFRALTDDEETQVTALLPVVSDALRQEAKNRGKDLDTMLEDGDVLENVLKSVVVGIVARCLLTPTTSEPMSQYSESALGYSVTGTPLNAGRENIYIMNSELKKLGLLRPRLGGIDFYGFN